MGNCNILLGRSLLVFHYYERCLKVDFSRYFCVKIPQLQPKKKRDFGAMVPQLLISS